MRSDAQLAFVPIGAPLSLVAGAGVDVPSTNVIDLLGQGTGTTPQNIIGTASLFGTDVGIGGKRPELEVVIGTALASANAATLTVQLQAAPDTAGTHQPGAWQTIVETPAITVAQGAAGTVIARLPFPPEFPANESPRYLRLNFHIPAATNFTAGTIQNALVTTVRDDQANKFQCKNYAVS